MSEQFQNQIKKKKWYKQRQNRLKEMIESH